MQKGHIIPLKSKCCPRLPTSMCLGPVGAHCAYKMAYFGVWYKIWPCNKISFILNMFIMFTNLISSRTKKCRGSPPKTFKQRMYLFHTHFLHSSLSCDPSKPFWGTNPFWLSGNPYHRGILSFTCHSGLRRVNLHQQGWEGAFWAFGSL